MSIISAFTAMGNAAILQAGVASASVPVIYAGTANLNLGTTQPSQIRLLNVGTAMIWLNFSAASAGTAVIPTAGTTTLGTPQPVLWAAPGVEIVMSIPCAIQPLVGVTGSPYGFWLNLIAAAAAQNLQMQLGEGL